MAILVKFWLRTQNKIKKVGRNVDFLFDNSCNNRYNINIKVRRRDEYTIKSNR